MSDKRLYIFCEGPTEESFSNEVLGPHFRARGVFVHPFPISNKRGSTSRRHKGGWVSYSSAKRFITLTMKQQHSADTWFTTMFDLYAIPDDFPGLAAAPIAPAAVRVAALETSFGNDIRTDQLWRFTPNLQLHEYEALLLAEPDAFSSFYPERAAGITALKQDVGLLAPEDVNEGRETAPSKRIIRHIPEYDGAKVVAGTLVAATIGLSTLRARCPHFDAWITELEQRTS
jgi:hypothetical protein